MTETPKSQTFSTSTISDSCEQLLKESGKPLHINQLYDLLVKNEFGFKGNYPIVSIAVSLNRDNRFKRVDEGKYDLIFK